MPWLTEFLERLKFNWKVFNKEHAYNIGINLERPFWELPFLVLPMGSRGPLIFYLQIEGSVKGDSNYTDTHNSQDDSDFLLSGMIV